MWGKECIDKKYIDGPIYMKEGSLEVQGTKCHEWPQEVQTCMVYTYILYLYVYDPLQLWKEKYKLK